MPIVNLGTIGDWDQATLTKFIQEVITGQMAAALIQAMKVEQLDVVRRLAIEDQVLVTAPAFRILRVSSNPGPGFKNAWVDFSVAQPATFYRDPFGIVHLGGLVKSGVVGSAAFTLPPGFHPGFQQSLGTISNNAIGRVDIDVSGNVTPVSPSSNTWVSLDGLTFRAA